VRPPRLPVTGLIERAKTMIDLVRAQAFAGVTA
jgi:hypothetical protein